MAVAAYCTSLACARAIPTIVQTQCRAGKSLSTGSFRLCSARSSELYPSRTRSAAPSRTFTHLCFAMAPQTQKAARIVSFDEGKIADNFANIEVHQIDVPSPGEGQVLVRFTQRPVQTSDLSLARGLYGPQDLPKVLGGEAVGVIEQLGPNASGNLKEGQRVVGRPWGVGTWQLYAAVDECNLLAVPDAMDDKTAAQSFANPLTAVGLVDTAAVPEGKYLLQAAAGSVLGRMLIQYAKRQGVKTINLVRRNEQIQELKAIGADEVINVKEEDVEKRVQEITGGEGAWAGLDPLAGDSTRMVLHSVRKGGSAYVYGALTGNTAHVKIMDLIAGSKLEGFMLPTWLKEGGEAEVQRKMDRVQQLLADKVITPLSGESYPLDKVHEAIAASQRPGRGGKVFLGD